MSRISALERLSAMSKDEITEVFKAVLNESGISYAEGELGEEFPGLGDSFAMGLEITIKVRPLEQSETKYIDNSELKCNLVSIPCGLEFLQEGISFGIPAA